MIHARCSGCFSTHAAWFVATNTAVYPHTVSTSPASVPQQNSHYFPNGPSVSRTPCSSKASAPIWVQTPDIHATKTVLRPQKGNIKVFGTSLQYDHVNTLSPVWQSVSASTTPLVFIRLPCHSTAIHFVHSSG
jgi:hypothetical protein